MTAIRWMSCALLAAACSPTAEAAPAAPPAPNGAVPERAWTVLIYGACDNSAEVDGNFFAFLDGVRGALADDAGLDVVLFLDRSERYSKNARTLGEDFTDARLYHVRAAGSTRLAGGREFPEITLASSYEPDSADPVNVRKLVAFGKAHFPARHYALMLYGHANGQTMCPDEESKSKMGFAQLTDGVPATESVDLMALELCNMGGAEIAYQWRPGNGGFSTDTLVAIPNAGPPLDWARVFARLRAGGAAGKLDPAALTGADFGRMIVEEGGAGRRAAHEEHEAVGCYDLKAAEPLKRAVDELAVRLASDPGGGAKAVIGELRGPGPGGLALNYGGGEEGEEPFVDLHDLCRRIAACDRLSEPVRAAARDALAAVDALVLDSWGGAELAGFERGASGVYVILPRDTETRGFLGGKQPMWSQMRWYAPGEVPRTYGRWAWCADGATAGNGKVENWFELLDSWYDDTSVGPGGANGYAP